MTNNNADDYANQRIGIFFPGNPANLTGQCVSLAKWFLGEMCQVDNPQIARGNAKDFGDTLVNERLAHIVQASERKRGDLVVWKLDGGGYGHIGVLCSGDQIFEENVNIKGSVSTQIDDGDGGTTTVYASRLDPLYASYRKGSPTFYRVYGYQETNSQTTNQQTNQGDDMIDQNTLTILFNLFLGRNPDNDAINHYVGKYTTSFVVSDINNSTEHAQKLANESNVQSSINTQLLDLTARANDMQAQINTLQTELSSKTKECTDAELKLSVIAEAQSDADAKAKADKIAQDKASADTANATVAKSNNGVLSALVAWFIKLIKGDK